MLRHTIRHTLLLILLGAAFGCDVLRNSQFYLDSDQYNVVSGKSDELQSEVSLILFRAGMLWDVYFSTGIGAGSMFDDSNVTNSMALNGTLASFVWSSSMVAGVGNMTLYLSCVAVSCPAAVLTCPQPVCNVSCPACPVDVLTCPEPVCNMTCPQPIVVCPADNDTCPEPVCNMSCPACPAPLVNLTCPDQNLTVLITQSGGLSGNDTGLFASVTAADLAALNGGSNGTTGSASSISVIAIVALNLLMTAALAMLIYKKVTGQQVIIQKV